MSIDATLRPFSIRIFVPNGDPDGLRLVEKSNGFGNGLALNLLNAWKSLVSPN